MTERERLYGKLVIDFVNAETATEAVYKTLDNLQYAFNISADLIVQLKACDWKNLLAESTNLTVTIGAIYDPEESKNVQKLEPIISTQETEIMKAKSKLQNLLERVLRGDDLDKIQPFLELLSIYNGSWGSGYRRGQLAFDSEGSLQEVTPFDEVNLYESILMSECPSFVTYCLIHFMKTKENRKYIGKCEHCNKYFIATRLNNQRFCNRQCQQKAYHSMPEAKSKKAAARREKYGWQPRVNA